MNIFLKKLRQQSYLYNNFDDINLPCQYNENIIDNVILFFKTESKLIYPAKSYFVAIVYAKCMEVYFQQDFFEMLNDPELLFDDKYFVIYSKNKKIYDEILNKININDILSYSSTIKTQKYFKQEFLICN